MKEFLLFLIVFLLYKKNESKFGKITKNDTIKSIKNDTIKTIKNKILIITAEDRDENFIRYHDLNFEKYCKIHGYTYLRTKSCLKPITTYWCKIHLVQKYLNDSDYDYIIWADSDTIITDLNISIEKIINDVGLVNDKSLVKSYKGQESYKGRESYKDIIIGRDCKYKDSFIDINAGFFIIKNSVIGKSFLDECLLTLTKRPNCILNNKEQGEWAGPCFEQGIMNELYRTKKYNKHIYVDDSQEIIYNDCYKSYIKDFKATDVYPFIIHLCGISNELRAEFFKKFI